MEYARSKQQVQIKGSYLPKLLDQGIDYKIFRETVFTSRPSAGRPLRLEAFDYRPEVQLCKHPLVMAHGAGHASYHFQAFLAPYLAERGIRCITLSTRGHGESENPGKFAFKVTSLQTHQSDVRAVVEHFKSDSQAPILLGHSMGGLVVQRLLADGMAAQAGILVATMPHFGLREIAVRYAQRHPLRFMRMNATASLRALYETPEKLRESCFSLNRPVEEIAPFAERCRDYYFLAYAQALAPKLLDPEKIRQRSVPMLVVSAENDTIVNVAEQQRVAKALGVTAEVFKKTAHTMMLEPTAPELGDLIVSFLQRNGLYDRR